jgi:hypothetical protein
MGNFDLHFDEHSGHLTPHRFDEHHEHLLSLEELHHIQTHKATGSRWRFTLAVIVLFALGFGLAGILFDVALWMHVPN